MAASPYTAPGQPWERRFHLLLNLAVRWGLQLPRRLLSVAAAVNKCRCRGARLPACPPVPCAYRPPPCAAAPLRSALQVGGGFFPASEFGGFATQQEWDAAVATWTRPRLEIAHIKVWAWPPALTVA